MKLTNTLKIITVTTFLNKQEDFRNTILFKTMKELGDEIPTLNWSPAKSE